MKRKAIASVPTEADRDARLEAMRVEMRHAVYGLLRTIETLPGVSSVAQAVEGFVDRSALAAIEMIEVAASTTFASSAAASAAADGATARGSFASAASIEELHKAIIGALACIVGAARAGQPGVDEACHQFADSCTAWFADGIAKTGLRALVAIEQKLGVDPGLPN